MSEFENALEITGITKRYDGFTLENISFVLPKGSIMGFIGQNGAGKTTTIKSLLNIIAVDEGTIKILGKDHVQEERKIKEEIAVVLDELPFDDDLTAKQIETVLKHLYKQWDNDLFLNYMERFSLPLKRKVGKFSKGMKMKFQIATALSHHAKLLIMDEATAGLDPVVRNEMLDIFMEFLQDEEHSIFMSSHITTDIEKIADMVTFIDRGKVLLTGVKDEILMQHGLMKCTIEQYRKLSKDDFISARLSEVGVTVMVNDREGMRQAYPETVIDPATLEEILQYYVNRSKKEWS